MTKANSRSTIFEQSFEAAKKRAYELLSRRDHSPFEPKSLGKNSFPRRSLQRRLPIYKRSTYSTKAVLSAIGHAFDSNSMATVPFAYDRSYFAKAFRQNMSTALLKSFPENGIPHAWWKMPSCVVTKTQATFKPLPIAVGPSIFYSAKATRRNPS